MNKIVKIKKGKTQTPRPTTPPPTLESTISNSTLTFKDVDQGIDVLAFSSAIRAMGLSNRSTQPKKLSNYIRSGYLQIQLICSVILFQLRGETGASRDDLYDSVCEVFPMTTYSNFRKVLSRGVDNEIFIRTKDKVDNRRTIYSLSEDMVEPISTYFLSILSDFGNLYSQVIADGLDQRDVLKLLERLKTNTGMGK
tara:strand:+ start:179 stop:766 length:588 start_codon:yes stop_codon:yes gene_type:complete